jgi:putative transposase
MYGQVKADIREIIKVLCNYKKVEIIEGAICSDHVHLYVSIPIEIMYIRFHGILKREIGINDT